MERMQSGGNNLRANEIENNNSAKKTTLKTGLLKRFNKSLARFVRKKFKSINYQHEKQERKHYYKCCYKFDNLSKLDKLLEK